MALVYFSVVKLSARMVLDFILNFLVDSSMTEAVDEVFLIFLSIIYDRSLGPFDRKSCYQNAGCIVCVFYV